MVAVALGVTVITAPAGAPAGASDVRDDQWHLRSLRISEAHKITRGAGVTVAVIDTGVDPHPDLRKNLLQGTSVVPGTKGNGRTDLKGHGTHMAGIIAAHGQKGRDTALGIAPESKILPVQAEKPGDNAGSLDLAAGIDWAVEHGAEIINVSYASGPTPDLDDAIHKATARNVVVIAGSGNEGTNLLFGYPAAMPGVLAVGAVGKSGKPADFTVTGEKMGICAPGVDITTIHPKNRYYKSSGTSDATAVVSGAAALVRAKFPTLSAPDVIHRLQATATDIGKPGRDDECGFGVLNVVKALTADVPPLAGSTTTSAAPSASPTTAAPPASGSGSGDAAPKTRPASSNTPAIVGGGIVILLFGGLIALLVIRRRKHPPAA